MHFITVHFFHSNMKARVRLACPPAPGIQLKHSMTECDLKLTRTRPHRLTLVVYTHNKNQKQKEVESLCFQHWKNRPMEFWQHEQIYWMKVTISLLKHFSELKTRIQILACYLARSTAQTSCCEWELSSNGTRLRRSCHQWQINSQPAKNSVVDQVQITEKWFTKIAYNAKHIITLYYFLLSI
jgi:hypothetical protein